MSLATLVAKHPLRRPAKGADVRAVQLALRAAGAELVVDGDFGAITEAAVRRFQAAHGLAADGAVGPLTAAALDALDGGGTATPPAHAPGMSTASIARLSRAHPLLQKLFKACAGDPACPRFTILESQRGRADQERAFALGHSHAHFGQSAHNWSPAIALDVAPDPLDWSDYAAFKRLGAAVKAKAATLSIPLQWGGDWSSLKDYPHYELSPWRTFAAQAQPYAG